MKHFKLILLLCHIKILFFFKKIKIKKVHLKGHARARAHIYIYKKNH
jgi:hypothetical protein